jgi:hypothetical protein
MGGVTRKRNRKARKGTRDRRRILIITSIVEAIVRKAKVKALISLRRWMQEETHQEVREIPRDLPRS